MREPTARQLAEQYGAMGCRGRHCAHDGRCYQPRLSEPLPPLARWNQTRRGMS